MWPIIGDLSGELFAQVADSCPAEIHTDDLTVRDLDFDRPSGGERRRADLRHAVQEVPAPRPDFEPPVGSSNEAEGTGGVHRNRVARVTQVGNRDPQPRRNAYANELGVVGQVDEPTLTLGDNLYGELARLTGCESLGRVDRSGRRACGSCPATQQR